jgi:hypothetical protein
MVPDTLFGCPKVNFGIIQSRQQVHGGNNVSISIPPAFDAVKPLPMPMVLVAISVCRVGTSLTGIRGINPDPTQYPDIARVLDRVHERFTNRHPDPPGARANRGLDKLLTLA